MLDQIKFLLIVVLVTYLIACQGSVRTTVPTEHPTPSPFILPPAWTQTPLITPSPIPTEFFLTQTAKAGISTFTPTPYSSDLSTITPSTTHLKQVSLKFDLLFLNPVTVSDYTLMYWDHETGQSKDLIFDEEDLQNSEQIITPRPSIVWQYSVSADHRRVGVLRLIDNNNRDPNRSELGVFDLDIEKFISLGKFETIPRWASISPDGQWFVYILPRKISSSNLTRTAGLATQRNRVLAGCDTGAGTIFALRIDDPDQHVEISSSDKNLWRFAWAPDSRTIAWSDEQGIWLASINEPQPRMVAPERSFIVPNGKLGIYAPPVWSPDRRYLLALSQEREWEIIDTQTGYIGRVPESYNDYFPNANLVWLSDGRLFGVLAGNPSADLLPYGEIWSISSNDEVRLVLEQRFEISANPNLYPISPYQFEDGVLAFALVSINKENHQESGLFIVDESVYLPRRMSDTLPIRSSEHSMYASWVPNGVGALIHNETGIIQRFFVPVNGAQLSNIPQFRRSVCCFTWLLPKEQERAGGGARANQVLKSKR